MKQKLTIALLMFWVCSTHAQVNHYYQRISLKTNLASLLSLGVEFPVKDGLTVEYNVRRMRTGIFEKNVHRDERLNLKYHWPMRGFMDDKKSFYVMAGFHSCYRSYEKRIKPAGGYESAYLNRNNFVYGIGFQGRRLDFWVAMESTLFERDNSLTTTDAKGEVLSAHRWKGNPGLSVGLNFVLFNFRK